MGLWRIRKEHAGRAKWIGAGLGVDLLGAENLGWGALFFNPSFGHADHLVVTTGDTAS